MDGAVDAGVVDVEMRHQPHLRQVTDGGADAVRVEVRGQGLEAFRRDFDEHHVGVLRMHADRGRIAQSGCETFGAGVIVGQPRDVMIERMQSRRRRPCASVARGR